MQAVATGASGDGGERCASGRSRPAVASTVSSTTSTSPRSAALFAAARGSAFSVSLERNSSSTSGQSNLQRRLGLLLRDVRAVTEAHDPLAA